MIGVGAVVARVMYRTAAPALITEPRRTWRRTTHHDRNDR
ncbi:Uncharacterised protein [Mycobacteroides abscessus subsp. bolletii]|nr:Uncharacterised protein [Mycobacteroides abscessus subsp. bolletii]